MGLVASEQPGGKERGEREREREREIIQCVCVCVYMYARVTYQAQFP